MKDLSKTLQFATRDILPMEFNLSKSALRCCYRRYYRANTNVPSPGHSLNVTGHSVNLVLLINSLNGQAKHDSVALEAHNKENAHCVKQFIFQK